MIPYQVPSQSFEIIRDRIGEILKNELANQANIYSDPELNAGVFIERMIEVSQGELATRSVVNVYLDSGDFETIDVQQENGEYKFVIQAFVKAVANQQGSGDQYAMIKLEKLLGRCRGIILDTAYLTLGFARPFINRRRFVQINILNPGKQDTANLMTGRLVLHVIVNDAVPQIEPSDLGSFQTRVRLADTEFGYEWVDDNTYT